MDFNQNPEDSGRKEGKGSGAGEVESWNEQA
jgi:hypothetical protein